MCGVACFFRDENSRPCKIILGLPEIGRHIVTIVVDEIKTILDDFGITRDRIGYAVLDNARNNDTAMEQLGHSLGFDDKAHHCRCIRHIIYLAAKALLFGNDADAFEEQLCSAALMSRDYYTIWRAKGLVGKLHNLVVDIDRSDRQVWH